MLEKLNKAIEANDITALRALLEKNPALSAKDEYWESPLYTAARAGNAEITAVLIEKGVDPNYRDFAGTSALYIASEKGHTSVVEFLLNAGAQIDTREGYENSTPLMADGAPCIMLHGTEGLR